MRTSMVVAAILVAGVRPAAAQSAASGPDPAALDAIVGTWQSDTVGGAWALSTCARSPQGGAVICEQTITTPGGVRHAVNVFAVDSAAGRYAYYGIVQPGAPVRPVPLAIAGRVWTYGGLEPAPDSLYHRTINDFSGGPGGYTWRAESSRDGLNWVVQVQGRATRRR